MSISELTRLKSLTPIGETASARFENAVLQAIDDAEDAGLCWGMIVAVLSQAQYWMHQRVDESDG